MDYSLDYASQRIAADASADARATFIRRTYGHLAGAILAFAPWKRCWSKPRRWK